MKVLGIIPARMASTRFPGKPLVKIGGKSMIRRVYERAQESRLLNKLIVATDHLDISNEVASFGGNVLMTAEHHLNGTERCAEVVAKLDEAFDVVVNIQGDEPFFESESIEKILACFASESVQIASLAKQIEKIEDVSNPSVVKVVFTNSNKALYFSRSPIPFNRDEQEYTYYKHIGLYAYRTEVLKDLVKLPEGRLEQLEKLEQLRWMENAYEIYLAFTKHDSNSVDTPEDLIALLKQFNIED